jgi:signal peptidase
VGSVIVCAKAQHPERLAADEIVTFHTLSGAVVTHRIIEVVTDGNGNISYRTKGDNPINSPDPELLTPDRVIGVFAVKIPFT